MHQVASIFESPTRITLFQTLIWNNLNARELDSAAENRNLPLIGLLPPL